MFQCAGPKRTRRGGKVLIADAARSNGSAIRLRFGSVIARKWTPIRVRFESFCCVGFLHITLHVTTNVVNLCNKHLLTLARDRNKQISKLAYMHEHNISL